MSEKLKKQIIAIRDSGEVNMIDYKIVQLIAFNKQYYDLVSFIAEDENAYLRYIFFYILLT